jgi:hypothetical protein
MTSKLRAMIWSLLALCSASTSAIADCANGGSHVEMRAPKGAPFKVMLELNPKPVVVSSPVQAKIGVCIGQGISITRIAINATMPLHRHGMNYRATLRRQVGNTFKATGLFFHMPGLWRIEVSVRKDQQTLRYFHDVEVK